MLGTDTERFGRVFTYLKFQQMFNFAISFGIITVGCVETGDASKFSYTNVGKI